MDVLFNRAHLDNALESTVRELDAEIAGWDADQLLTQSENEIATYLAEKYAGHCPVLDRDSMYVDEPTEVTQRRPGFDRMIEVVVPSVRVHVPYEGERPFFHLRPNQFSHSPPMADVTDTELIFTFEGDVTSDQIRQRLLAELAKIENYLTASAAMAASHNDRLFAYALKAIQERKAKLLAARSTVAGLGIPVKRRGDPPSVSVPVQRRRPTIVRPTPTSGSYAPEYMLADSDYEEAVRILTNSGRQFERAPSTTVKLDEEERRDLMLVALNAVFEGQAGGEVFNGAGKTDILLREGDRNVFIAEIKLWSGPAAFVKAIDQLLSYLVWRDTKAVLVLFIHTKNATETINKAIDAITNHPQCVRSLGGDPSERTNYVMVAKDDQAREIKLAFLPFVITQPVADEVEV